MCLNTTKNCFRYAKKDIECYKVMIDGPYHLKTPYVKDIVPFEVINGAKPFVAKGRAFTLTDKDKNTKTIFNGYIHTYTTMDGALAECRSWNTERFEIPEPLIIFKCIIPKGTRYAKGSYKTRDAYASKQVVFKERMSTKKIIIA